MNKQGWHWYFKENRFVGLMLKKQEIQTKSAIFGLRRVLILLTARPLLRIDPSLHDSIAFSDNSTSQISKIKVCVGDGK